MTTDDNKAVQNLKETAQELMPLGVLDSEPVAGTPAIFKKTKARPGSTPLKKRKYEQVAQLVAYEQKSFAEAYSIVYGGEPTLVRANAARLKREHPEILERVEFLDQEVKEETLLHRGTTYAHTINRLNDVMEAMYSQRSNPKAAKAMIAAAGLILKATGQEGESTSVEERIEAERTGEVLPGIIASIRRVVTRRKEG